MQAALLGLGSISTSSAAASSLPGASSFIAPAGFPTSVFSSYYYSPEKPTQEPQPIIHDPVLNIDFPSELTDPFHIPQESHDDPVFPKPEAKLSDHQKQQLIRAVSANVTRVINTNNSSSCTKCKAALEAAKPAALFAPSMVPDAMVSLCKQFSFKDAASCEHTYAAEAFGAVWTQVLAYADLQGLDGDYICNSVSSDFCDEPYTSPLDTADLFPKPKPENPRVPKPSGKRVKVAHLSDFHLDPRYAVDSEANCTTGMCCRVNEYNSASEDQVLFPAPAYGYFLCDTPYDLGLAALQAVGPLTGTGKGKHQDSLAFTLYTGDLVSHDSNPLQIDRAYVEYTETSIFHMFKTYLTGPVFAALGNHDTSPYDIDAPHALPDGRGQQQSWNYDHVSGLWLHEGWIDHKTVQQARTHYGGYSVKTHHGLRIIAFNTDFWYKANYLNFINTTDPDVSGMLNWMISELQKAEDTGERVWLVGHVLSGWDGSNPLPNPTDLFYQIVERYSPHVIANAFYGHTHEDQFMIYYANNGTVQSADSALTTGWIMPSVTPLTNLNSAFRMYEVDTGDFNIYNAYTFFSNVSDFASLSETGPVYRFEYSTRDTYGAAAGWPEDAPLNATFWHRVTEAMESDGELVTLHNSLQGKSSVKSPACTTEECRAAKVCYMRSGSVALGRECIQGYGSVQSAFK
ncbi:hypothetical protein FE257_008878 [Aspergillus nanangensis]|uniref:Sphingomyelin phosphodiesterase n=1 Tax=Aspergillus nanangensis TaxID=2582783 RepID=A0AAD4GYE4_ASPNN|nr:hypothetical protein FE257_008878 [Aspergillus nanangensis]